MAEFSLVKRIRHGRRHRFVRVFLVIVCIVLSIVILLNAVFIPRILAVVIPLLTNRMTSFVSASVYEIFRENGYTYDDFIHMSLLDDGSVSYMNIDTVQLDTALYAITSRVLQQIDNERTIEFSIPVGTLFGWDIVGGVGPSLPMRVLIAEGIHACFRSEFATQGINQTLHSVYFSLKIKGRVLLAGGIHQIDLSQEILATQTVILGKVPDSFTHISRLTADITEEEIDDIFDFGANE